MAHLFTQWGAEATPKIIACVDGDFTVKTLRLGNGERGMGNGDRGLGNGEVRLVAANPNYPDIVLKSGQEMDYFGKVTACIHQFKKGKYIGQRFSRP